MFYWFAHIIVGLLTRVLFRVQITGAENVPRKGAFILASNHRSNLDPIIIAVAIERKLFFMGKKELFQSRVGIETMKRLNVIKLDREGIDRTALKKGLLALHRGKGLLLFPEGKRSLDSQLGLAKSGVALFAFGANVPVIPVFIKGTERALPPQSHFIRATKVRVIFGKGLIPLPPSQRSNRKLDYQEFTSRIMQGIAELKKSGKRDRFTLL